MIHFHKDLFDSEMGPLQVLPLQISVNLGVMVMKEYTTLPRFPVLVGWLVLYSISSLVGYPLLNPVFIYIYIYIYHHHHHHHIALVARISLTLSRHSSLSFIALGRSSGQHPVSSHSC